MKRETHLLVTISVATVLLLPLPAWSQFKDPERTDLVSDTGLQLLRAICRRPISCPREAIEIGTFGQRDENTLTIHGRINNRLRSSTLWVSRVHLI